MIRNATLLLLLWVTTIAAAVADERARLVVWAPGYPGSAEQASTTMQDLAAALTEASGGTESVAAVYEPSLERGVELLADQTTVAAIVPAAVLWRFGEELGLQPMLKIVPEGGRDERWTLVARAGAVKGPAGLADWEIRGLAGVSPGFVRGPVLGAWGELPESAAVVFDPAVRSALRRAAEGERIAVLLDRGQHDALPALPFAGQLEALVHSPSLPSSFLCVVRGRLAADRAERLRDAASRLTESEHGREALAAMRIERIVPADEGWGRGR